MKQGIIHFSFIASALSLCLGIPGQARAADGGCDGRSSIHRKLVPGDTLSKISREVYGTLYRYQEIADANHIPDANVIIAGRTIIIPCSYDVASVTDAAADVAPKPTSKVVSTEQDLLSWQTLSTPLPAVGTNFGFPSSETFAQRKPETHATEETVDAKSDSKSIEIETEPAPLVEEKRAPAKPGRYEIELGPKDAPGLTAGQFPAFSLDRQDKKGFWRKRAKTDVTIRETDGGNFLVDAVFKTAPTAHSAIVFDLGEGNLVQIGGDMMSEPTIPNTKFKHRNFKKNEYAALEMKFVKKSSRGMAALRKVAPIALPAALGFAVGGPVGAAFGGGIPFARNFIAAKLERMRQPQPEETAPHVQYVMSNQADEIERLKQQLTDQQRQIDILISNGATNSTKGN